MNTKEAVKIIYEYIDIAKNNSSLSIGFKKKDIDEFKDIIELLQRGEKLRKDLIQFIKKENPYLESVFLPIKKEDFNKINNYLKKELGYPIDRLSGNLGRKIYKSVIKEIKEVIK